MRKAVDVSESIKDTKVERTDFEAVVKNLLKHPQTSKQEVSRKIHRRGRARPLTKPLGGR